MKQVINKSETCQDLFAYYAHNIIKPNTTGYWVDFGARNWGDGFGQNNTVLLYENGWSGLSMDIGDFEHTYAHLDKNRVHFEKIDCTNTNEVCELFKKVNVPKTIDYLNFDIDDATEYGLLTLDILINDGYVFNIITMEHDSYRAGISVREKQRNMLYSYGYELVGELDLYEDWWIHKSVYNNQFQKLNNLASIKHNGGFNQHELAKLYNIVNELNTNNN